VGSQGSVRPLGKAKVEQRWKLETQGVASGHTGRNFLGPALGKRSWSITGRHADFTWRHSVLHWATGAGLGATWEVLRHLLGLVLEAACFGDTVPGRRARFTSVGSELGPRPLRGSGSLGEALGLMQGVPTGVHWGYWEFLGLELRAAVLGSATRRCIGTTGRIHSVLHWAETVGNTGDALSACLVGPLLGPALASTLGAGARPL
jgi:hypothetical protein